MRDIVGSPGDLVAREDEDTISRMADGRPRPRRYASLMAQPVPAQEPSADSTVIGIVLLVVGCGWLVQAAGLAAVTWPLLLSAGLVALGAALVLTARRRTSPLPVIAGIVMAGVLAATTATVNLDAGVLRAGAGDRFFQPVSTAQLDAEFATAAGEMVLDLERLELVEGIHEVRARVGVGELRVIVPADVAVQVRASVGMGEIAIFDTVRTEGINEARTHRDPGYAEAIRRLDIHLGAGIGHIEVVRAR